MKIKKDIVTLCLVILFAGSICTMEMKASKNGIQVHKNLVNGKISSLLTIQNIATATMVVFVAYSIMEGDIPFVDLPQSFLEYFSPTSWYSYFTTPPVTIESLESIVHACMPDSSMSQAAQVKSYLECIPNTELKSIINSLPESILQRIPGASIIIEKVLQDIHSLSDHEISTFIESIKTCIATMKESGQTLSFYEKSRIFRLYLHHYDVIENLKALMADQLSNH